MKRWKLESETDAGVTCDGSSHGHGDPEIREKVYSDSQR
jgi:hypothetical protein